MSRKVTAAAVHAAPVFMNKKASLAKVVRLIGEAKKDTIELLVFPETFVPGYPYFIECYPPIKQVPALATYASESVVVGPEDLHEVQSACRQHSIAIVLGISERVAAPGFTLFNSQVYIDRRGRIVGVHRKLQPTYVERMVWAQGSGHTLRTYDLAAGITEEAKFRIGGLCCWENTMNGARQALIQDGQEIHAGAWPALNTMAGFEGAANAQIEALMKAHALTGQTFVICASNYVDDTCLDWMRENLGEQDMVKAGGGWSAVIHPFCVFLAGPHEGAEEKPVKAEIDLSQMGQVKVWIDAAGHYKRPEILKFELDRRPVWPDDVKSARWPLQMDQEELSSDDAAEEEQKSRKGDGSRNTAVNGTIR